MEGIFIVIKKVGYKTLFQRMVIRTIKVALYIQTVLFSRCASLTGLETCFSPQNYKISMFLFFITYPIDFPIISFVIFPLSASSYCALCTKPFHISVPAHVVAQWVVAKNNSVKWFLQGYWKIHFEKVNIPKNEYVHSK